MPREGKAPTVVPGRLSEAGADPACHPPPPPPSTGLGFIQPVEYFGTHSPSVPFNPGEGQSLCPHRSLLHPFCMQRNRLRALLIGLVLGGVRLKVSPTTGHLPSNPVVSCVKSSAPWIAVGQAASGRR